MSRSPYTIWRVTQGGRVQATHGARARAEAANPMSAAVYAWTCPLRLDERFLAFVWDLQRLPAAEREMEPLCLMQWAMRRDYDLWRSLRETWQNRTLANALRFEVLALNRLEETL